MVDVTPLRQIQGFRWLYGGMFFAQAGRQLTVREMEGRRIKTVSLSGNTKNQTNNAARQGQ